jgi:glucose/mannose transport system permease protein
VPNSLRGRIRGVLPQLVLSPAVLTVLVFVHGFVLWTVLLSFTNSKMMPRFDHWVGFHQYARLWANPRWHVAVGNLGVYAALFVVVAMALGLLLAILLDQDIRGENVLRSIYLYPMALSSIVTGTAWQWILNPTLGIEKLVRAWGWSGFRFDWLVDPKMALYTIVIADVWKSAGFVMILFLVGLRSIDENLVRAAAIDGANVYQLYRRIMIPALRPVFISVVVLLVQRAIVSFDMVMALTAGGPGYSTDLPAVFMVVTAFQRSDLALGAAAATMMLLCAMAIVGPYLYHELREQDDA